MVSSIFKFSWQRTVFWEAETKMGNSSADSVSQKALRPLPKMFLNTAASLHLVKVGTLLEAAGKTVD